jgi:hypothetical protein
LDVFTSDDDGKTYQTATGKGDPWPTAPGFPNGSVTMPFQFLSECQVVELTNGSVMLNARNELGLHQPPGHEHRRAYAISDDGGSSWGGYRFAVDLPEPGSTGCMAGLIDFNGVLYFSNPAGGGGGGSREGMTLKKSLDQGATWQVERLIDAGPAAYSTIVPLTNSTLGVIYERNAPPLAGSRAVNNMTIAIVDVLQSAQTDGFVDGSDGNVDHRSKSDDDDSTEPEPTDRSVRSSSLRYVSWYSAYEYYHNASRLRQAPNQSFANLQMDRNLSFLLRSHEELDLPGMINLRKSRWCSRIWNYPGADAKRLGATGSERRHPRPPHMLARGWEAAVDDATATLLPLAQGSNPAIKGVMLGDELVEGGFPLSNLSALASRVRRGLGKSVFIYTNEAFAVGGACNTSADCKHPTRQVCTAAHTCDAKRWPYIPPDIDFISSDQVSNFCSRLPFVVQSQQDCPPAAAFCPGV